MFFYSLLVVVLGVAVIAACLGYIGYVSACADKEMHKRKLSFEEE